MSLGTITACHVFVTRRAGPNKDTRRRSCDDAYRTMNVLLVELTIAPKIDLFRLSSSLPSS